MPFLKVQFEDEQLVVTNSFGIKPSNVPVFFFPDILGNGSIYQDLAWIMHESGDKRPLYVWYDPLIVKDKKHPYKENATLEDIGKSAAEEMVELFPTGPFLSFGFSDGCSKSLSAGQSLKMLGLYVSEFLIDGVSPQCTRGYSPNCLLDVVNYTVRLSTFNTNENDEKEFDFNFTSEDKHLLDSLDPITFIDTAANIILEREKNIHKESFNKFIQIAKQRIKDQIDRSNHPEKSSEIKLDKIVALITKDTADKCGDKYGGWDKYTNKLSLITNEQLCTQKHMSLLREPESLENLARNLKAFIKKETHPTNLLSSQLNYLNRMYSTESEETQEQLGLLTELSNNNSRSPDDDIEKENLPANVQPLPIIEKFSSDDNKKMEKNKLEADQFVVNSIKALETLKEKIYKNNKCFLFPSRAKGSQSCQSEQQHTLVAKQSLVKNSPIKVNSS